MEPCHGAAGCGQRKRRGESKTFPSGRAARLSFETDLRGYGFEEAEIEAAWSCRDGVERVAIELMVLAAGLVSIEDLASDVVRRARNTFGWAGVARCRARNSRQSPGARGKNGKR